MQMKVRLVALVLVGCLGVSATAKAQSTPSRSSRKAAIWTIVGAGGGFGVGVWAGLTKFDDAINSERKVWTTAVVGAAIGAVGGYLIGRSGSSRPSPAIRSQSIRLPETARQTYVPDLSLRLTAPRTDVPFRSLYTSDSYKSLNLFGIER